MALTVIFLVQTLEDEPQLLFVVLEVMNKLLKVQLPIQVLITSFDNFLDIKQIRSVRATVTPLLHGEKLTGILVKQAP